MKLISSNISVKERKVECQPRIPSGERVIVASYLILSASSLSCSFHTSAEFDLLCVAVAPIRRKATHSVQSTYPPTNPFKLNCKMISALANPRVSLSVSLPGWSWFFDPANTPYSKYSKWIDLANSLSCHLHSVGSNHRSISELKAIQCVVSYKESR